MTSRLRPFAVPVGLAVLVLATRLPRLDRPRSMVFDEVFYALDAADLLRHGVESNPAHPPLAKWLIAGGIRIFGFSPFGWRTAALLFGVLLVLATWAAARKLTDSAPLAVAAGVFVALDGIAFTTGRLALLDVFVATATTAAAWTVLAALEDRDDAAKVRRWCWATAVLLGFGTAMKWGAVWTLPVVAAVFLGLEWRRRRLVSTLAILVLVPVGIYVASYAVWFTQAERTHAGLAHCHDEEPCRLGLFERVEVWFDHQRDLVEFHAGLDTDNPEAAPAWHWATLADPANLFNKPCLPTMGDPPSELDDGTCPSGDATTRTRLLALANPVSWFAGMAALIALTWLAIRRRDDAAGVVLALAAAQWVPWMLAGREVYSYYAVSLVPLLALAVVLSLDRMPRVRRWTLLPLVIGSVVAFAFLYPLLVGDALTPGAADLRLLFPSWS